MIRSPFAHCVLAIVISGYGSVAYSQEAEEAQTPQAQQTDRAQHDPNTHVVETDTQAVTGPTERTDATIITEESLDDRALLGESTAENAGEAGAAGQAERSPSSQSDGISDVDAAALVGRELKSRDGEDVGEISHVARSLLDQQLHALVDVGGFLGVGERTVSVPLESAEIDQDGNVATQMSREAIENMEAYDPAQYASMDEDDRVLR